MASIRPRVKFTYQDYINAPEDKRYELLDGDLVTAPSPIFFHQTTSRNIGYPLWSFVKRRELGEVCNAPLDVVLSDTDVVQPDLLFISKARLHIVVEGVIRGAPDLVIEVLSPSTTERDRTYKRRLYARHGVREYWLVNLDAKTIEVFVLGQGDFELAATYSQRQVLRSPLLEGFRLSLREVFS